MSCDLDETVLVDSFSFGSCIVENVISVTHLKNAQSAEKKKVTHWNWLSLLQINLKQQLSVSETIANQIECYAITSLMLFIFFYFIQLRYRCFVVFVAVVAVLMVVETEQQLCVCLYFIAFF